jgi:purine-nucleoside phosphorylase
VCRAIRVGTCTSLGDLNLGDLLVVSEANGQRTDSDLTEALASALPEAHRGAAVSLDTLYRPERDMPSVRAEAADMQTAGLLAGAAEHGVAAAALLIVSEKSDSGQLRDEELEETAKRAGSAASSLFSTSG